MSLAEVIVGDYRPVLLVLLGGAALLLLIACVNVASLLLVRSESRRRELAVRSALGASRGRLIRQFVTEALALVAIGSVLGLVSARWAMQLLLRLIPADMMASMPFLQGAGLNARVLTCAAVIALLATIVCSMAPTLRLSLSDTRSGMADGERGSAGSAWHRLGFKLVVLELATAMVLLVGAGLLGKSLYRLLNVDLGFEPSHLATLQVAVPGTGYESNAQVIALGQHLIDRVVRLPGVESAGLASVLPVSFNGNTDWIRFVGRPYSGEHNEVNQRDVSADYFRTVRATLVRGRSFTEADDASTPRVVIINQALAQRYFPGEDPIGKKFGDTSLSPASIKEIVGVVADIREGQLDSEIWPAVYYPFNQSPDTFFALVVRTSQAEAQLLPTLGAAITKINPRYRNDAARDDERPHYGLADCLPAAFVSVAPRRLCRPRAGARDRRSLRSDCLYREPANARDWRAAGARRATARRLSAGARRSRTTGRDWHRTWARVRRRGSDANAQAPLRHAALGHCHPRRGCPRARRVGTPCELPTGQARGIGRPGASTAQRVAIDQREVSNAGTRVTGGAAPYYPC